MRTFQFSDAKSHKFWNIDVQGTSFTVTYGKVGTTGQTQTKSWPTAEKAQAEADKLIREKTGKGYVETTPSATTSDNDAFENKLIEDPKNVSAWSAYADYLMEQNDVRGEILQTHLALEDESLSSTQRVALKQKEAELLKTHQEQLFGAMAPFLLNQQEPTNEYRDLRLSYKLRGSWITELQIPRIGVELVRAMNKSPQLKLLQRLMIEDCAYEEPADSPNIPSYVDGTYIPGPDVPEDVPSEAYALHMMPKFPYLGSVRVLHLGGRHISQYDDERNCHTDGSIAFHLVKQMPHIEELYLLAHRVDANKLFALPMPNLRIFQLFHSNSYPLEKLAANASITKLTHLICHPHAIEEDDQPIRMKQLKAICKANWPNLQYLCLRISDFGDDGVKEIIKSGLLKRLKVLDLEAGCITDKGAELLAKCPDIANLEQLNLNINAMTAAGIAALRAVCKNVTADEQHNEVGPFDHEDGGEAPEYFYMGDIE